MTFQRTLLVHGPVRSGKTTALSRATAMAGGAAGVIAPDGPDGRRFVDLTSGVEKPLEQPKAGEAVVEVGRFRFRRDAFDWANQRLLTADRAGAVVVDEVGPLELRGEGLSPGLTALLAAPPALLVLVVRDTLIDAVRTRWSLDQAGLWGADTWPQLPHRLSGVR